MRGLRFVAMLCLTAALYASAWSIPLAGAQPPGKEGCLAIHEMHATLTAEKAQEEGVPPGYRIVASADGVFKVLVREAAAITGGDLADAKAGVAPGARVPIVELDFTAAGAPKLADLTSRNIGRALAIVVGGRLLSAPIVRTPILKGKLYVEGNLTPDSASQLARSMRSPACS